MVSNFQNSVEDLFDVIIQRINSKLSVKANLGKAVRGQFNVAFPTLGCCFALFCLTSLGHSELMTFFCFLRH